MPLPCREILDSEDEDDLVAVKGHSPVATLAGGEDAPPDLDADQPTASTAELLRRAHLDFMAPTQDDPPVANFSDLAATSVPTSPSSTHKKRPLTSSDFEPRSSGKLKRIKIVSKNSSQNLPAEPSLPAVAPPFIGTSDTIPGPTIPSVADIDAFAEKTPKTRARRSSQRQSSSADQQNSLTPWSVSAVGSSDRLNSDDAAVGLPKEMYKPRPSRSRSAQVDNTDYDFTANPEKIVKKSKPKRSATDTAQAATSAPMFPATPILQAPEYERLSPTPEMAAHRNPTDDAQDVDPQIKESVPSSRPQSTTKKATKAKQPGKRGRPKKKPVIEEEEDDELAIDNEIMVANTKTPRSITKTEVQVVISPKATNKNLVNNILLGLGHKSKEPSPQMPSEEFAGDDLSALSRPNGDQPPDADVEEEALEDDKPKSTCKAETPKPTVAPKTAPNTSSTPKVVKKGAKSSPTKPSWQRTPYRVGLSKTQRIPSLLKVLKK